MSNKIDDKTQEEVLRKVLIETVDLFTKSSLLISTTSEERTDSIFRMLFSVVLVFLTDSQMATDKVIRENLKNFIIDVSNFSEEFIRKRRSKIKDMV
jgi:prenyltransferase beta subunit